MGQLLGVERRPEVKRKNKNVFGDLFGKVAEAAPLALSAGAAVMSGGALTPTMGATISALQTAKRLKDEQARSPSSPALTAMDRRRSMIASDPTEEIKAARFALAGSDLDDETKAILEEPLLKAQGIRRV